MKRINENALAVTVVDGQPMVSAELVEGLLFHYERTLERLARAIQKEGFMVIHDPVEDDFLCQRPQ